MTDEDADAEFAALMEGITFEEPTDVVDVTKLSDIELIDLLADTREQLLAMGAMLTDLQHSFGTREGTAEERELHSLRLACLTEMRKRGMG